MILFQHIDILICKIMVWQKSKECFNVLIVYFYLLIWNFYEEQLNLQAAIDRNSKNITSEKHCPGKYVEKISEK